MGVWIYTLMVSAVLLTTKAVYLPPLSLTENSRYDTSEPENNKESDIDEIVIMGKDKTVDQDSIPYEVVQAEENDVLVAVGKFEEPVVKFPKPEALESPTAVRNDAVPQPPSETVHGSGDVVASKPVLTFQPITDLEETWMIDDEKEEKAQETYRNNHRQTYNVALSYLEYSTLPWIEKVLNFRRKIEKVVSGNRIPTLMRRLLKSARRRTRSTPDGTSPLVLDDDYFGQNNPYRRTSEHTAMPEMSSPVASSYYRSQFMPPRMQAYSRYPAHMRTLSKYRHQASVSANMGTQSFQVPKWKYYVPYPWKSFRGPPSPFNRKKAKESPRELPYGALPYYPHNSKPYNEPMEPGIIKAENMQRSQQGSEIQPLEPLGSPIEITNFDSSNDLADPKGQIYDNQIQRASGVMRPNGYIGPMGSQGNLGIPNFQDFGRIASRNSFRIADEMDRGPRYSPIMFDDTQEDKISMPKEQPPLNDPSSLEEYDEATDIQDDYSTGTDDRSHDNQMYRNYMPSEQPTNYNPSHGANGHINAPFKYQRPQQGNGKETDHHSVRPGFLFKNPHYRPYQPYNSNQIVNGQSSDEEGISTYYGQSSDAIDRMPSMAHRITSAETTTWAPSTRYPFGHQSKHQTSLPSFAQHLNYPTSQENTGLQNFESFGRISSRNAGQEQTPSYLDNERYSPEDNFDVYKKDYIFSSVNPSGHKEKPAYAFGKSGYGMDSYEQMGGSLGYGGGYGGGYGDKSLSSGGGYGLNSIGTDSTNYGGSPYGDSAGSPTIIKVPTYKSNKDDKSMQWTSGYQDKGYGVRGETGQKRGALSGNRRGSDKSSRADQTSSKGSTVKTYSYGGNGWYKEDVEGEEVDSGGGMSENKGNFGGDYKKQYQEAAAPHHLYRGGQNGYYREHSHH